MRPRVLNVPPASERSRIEILWGTAKEGTITLDSSMDGSGWDGMAPSSNRDDSLGSDFGGCVCVWTWSNLWSRKRPPVGPVGSRFQRTTPGIHVEAMAIHVKRPRNIRGDRSRLQPCAKAVLMCGRIPRTSRSLRLVEKPVRRRSLTMETRAQGLQTYALAPLLSSPLRCIQTSQGFRTPCSTKIHLPPRAPRSFS